MHTIERLIDGTRTPTKNVSDIIDFREHVSMALHVGFLAGSTAILYGSILEPSYNAWIPVNIEGSTTISTDGVFVVPPYYRYYRLNLTRAGGATPTILFYGIKQGSFITRLASDISISDGEFDKIRKGTQADILVQSSPLTSTPTTLGSFSYLGNQEIYLISNAFSIQGKSGALVTVKNTIGITTTTLFQYSLNGELPTMCEEFPFLYKLNHGTSPGTLSIEASKFIYNWDTNLFGRVTYIIR